MQSKIQIYSYIIYMCSTNKLYGHWVWVEMFYDSVESIAKCVNRKIEQKLFSFSTQ